MTSKKILHLLYECLFVAFHQKKIISPAFIRSKEGKDIFKGRNGKDGIASRRHNMNKVHKKKKSVWRKLRNLITLKCQAHVEAWKTEPVMEVSAAT